MTSRTKRILQIVVLAVVASAATKIATYAWRSNAEAEYRVAKNIRLLHFKDDLPEYGRTWAMLQLSRLVDEVLVWIVIFVFLLKVFFWAMGKLFNNWVDGAPTRDKKLDAILMDNGDIVIRIDH